MKHGNIMTISTKGGCGKSLVSQHILAGYLLDRHGHADLVEVDEENHDANWLKDSAIKSSQVNLAHSRDGQEEMMDDLLPIGTKDRVIDVGGNLTARHVIHAFRADRVRAAMIDLVVFPVSDNGATVESAEKTIALFNDSIPDMMGKAVIALNRMRDAVRPLKRQKTRYDNVIALAEKYNLPVIQVPDMDGIENIRRLGQLCTEMDRHAEELIRHLDQQIEKAMDSNNAKKATDLSARSRIITWAVEDYAPQIRLVFDQLDALLGGVGETKEAATAAK